MLKITRLTEKILLAEVEEKSLWKCNGLAIETGEGAVLIDCNFPGDDLDFLLKYLDKPVLAYFVTHFHIDHVNHLHEVSSRNLPLLVPEAEQPYLLDMENFLRDTGAVEIGARNDMKALIGTMEYQTIGQSGIYKPGSTYTFGNTTVETVPLPGHTPGHSGFRIKEEGIKKEVLFVSDLGIEKLGAWYGFKYCSVDEIILSVNRVLDLYQPDSIIVGSHSSPFFDYKPEILHEILEKISSSGERLLEILDGRIPEKIESLVFRGVYYGAGSIRRMTEPQKKLYRFWEYYTIKNLLDLLLERGSITGVDGRRWMTNSLSGFSKMSTGNKNHMMNNNEKEY